jgi:hypothetical protein
MPKGIQRTDHTVFMKTIPPIGPAVKGSIVVYVGLSLLGSH